MTDCTRLKQEGRTTSRQNACTHDRHSISLWWHQSASQKWSVVHQFDTCRSRLQSIRPIVLMRCCYNSSCSPHVGSLSSISFSRTVLQRTERLMQSTFLSITLSHVDQFLTFFERKLRSKFEITYSSKDPPRLKYSAPLPCDLSLITIIFQGVARSWTRIFH